jgi:uncharacterized protein (TIGR02646 family)
MKQIIKHNEPRSLIQHRAQKGNYENFHKDELRASLINEQGHICCYCMCRIPHTLKPDEREKNYPDSKIEHVKCRSKNSALALSYQNLLLSCNGKHGFPRQMQTCDSYKGENDLSFNPADTERNIEDYIKYSANGEIFSDDKMISQELNEVLNLNTKDLTDIREVFYKDIQTRIINEGKRRQGKEIQRKFYEAKKQQLLTLRDGKFEPYCMIGIYLINKKLSKFK